MFVHHLGALTSPRLIVNFPTKRHWRNASRLDDIRAGLTALVNLVITERISSIAVPPLGCGNGGLDWNHVRPVIVAAFAALPEVDVQLFEQRVGASEDRTPTTARPRPGRAVAPGRAVPPNRPRDLLPGKGQSPHPAKQVCSRVWPKVIFKTIPEPVPSASAMKGGTPSARRPSRTDSVMASSKDLTFRAEWRSLTAPSCGWHRAKIGGVVRTQRPALTRTHGRRRNGDSSARCVVENASAPLRTGRPGRRTRPVTVGFARAPLG